MLRRFGFAVFAVLISLMPGCPKTAEQPKTGKVEPKLEAPVKEPAAMEKNQLAFERPVKVVTVTCKTSPNEKKDEPNICDWYVRIDGKSGPGHDGIGEMAFSPDGNHIAYAAKKGSIFHLIVDSNVESPEYDDMGYITFSPDGKRLAYGARTGNKWFAVVDGNAGPNYDFVDYFAFSPDGRRFAYAAGKQNGKKQTVVLDGVEICPPYDVTGRPVFSNDSKRIAFTADEGPYTRFVVVDGKSDGTYEAVYEPVFSPDSRHYAYFAEKGNERFLVFDGKAGTPWEDLPKRDSPVFGPNDNRAAYRAQSEGNWFVVVGDHVGPFFEGIGDRSLVLSADGRRHAYVVKQGEQSCVVVNDQNGPVYDGIAADGPVFSPDGNHFAYGAMLESRYFMVLDHQAAPGYDNYDGIGRNSISFSPDGSHLIYKVLNDRKWHIAVDGRLGPAYDELPYKATITENAVEYFAERDGWVLRCRRPFPRPAVEKTVTVNEQRLTPLGDAQNFQRIAHISDNLMVIVSACLQEMPDNFVFVLGGTFRNTESGYYGKSVSSFYIGKFEVTQKEWFEVMGSNPSKFIGDNLPVEMVSWYDSVEYCNKRSIKEGLSPYYNIDRNKKDPNNKSDTDDIKWTVTLNKGANGYRLPTEAEWEYAAGGGQMSRSYIYSGSSYVDEAAWYWRNSGDEYQPGFWFRSVIENNNNKTKPVGGKIPNELGLYDMSGNVREWCWDRHESSGPDDPQGRVWKGGGWIGVDFPCETSFRGSSAAHDRHLDTGLRVCRSR